MEMTPIFLHALLHTPMQSTLLMKHQQTIHPSMAGPLSIPGTIEATTSSGVSAPS